jgi:hypothetical protein
MGTLDRRVANLEAAASGGPVTYWVSIGSERDEVEIERALSQLDPAPRSTDLVIVVRLFADPDEPAEVVRMTGRHEDHVAAIEERLRAHDSSKWRSGTGGGHDEDH